MSERKLECLDLVLLYGNMDWCEPIVINQVDVDVLSYQSKSKTL